MGFELDRLMKQFGVSTPSLNYSGAGIPVNPGVRPTETDTLTGDALASAQTKYDNLLAKYNIDKVNYPVDKALYDTYKTEYQNRMLGTPQYMQAQFQTGNEPKSAALQYATSPSAGSNMGLKQFNQNIQNWAAQNPTANTSDINAYADKYGISAQDIYNATNNRWGNVLQVPKYGTAESQITTPVTPVTPVIPTTPITTPIATPISSVTPYSPITPYVPPVVPTVLPSPDVDFPPTIPTVVPPVEPPFVPSIRTKPIISTITDDTDPNNFPTITTTPLALPDIPVTPDKTGVVDITEVDPNITIPDTIGPNRAGGGDLPEEFDKYLSPETPAITTNTPTVVDTPNVVDTPFVVDNPFIVDNPIATDDGTTSGIQGAIDSLDTPYEVQPWENVDNSGFSFGSMAGDNSFNSGNNTYINPVSEPPSGLPDAFGSYPSESTYINDNDFSNPAEFLKPDYFGGADDFGKYGLGVSDFGGGGGGGNFFDMYDMANYAKGGRVKTHFQTGGINGGDSIEKMAENYGVTPQADIMSFQGSKLFPMEGQAPAPVSNQMTRRDAYPPIPQSPMDARATQLDALLQRYAGDSTDYSSELAEARKRSEAESLAFQAMIQKAIKGSADEAPSKAEMYFRLASAFGSPTKTGHIAETLSNVNKELAAYSKEERDAKKAQRALQLQMGLKGQEMRMTSAKDELATIKTLASEAMKDKRAITTEIIKDFIKSGEPESAAGKQAKDEGLKPGTKEFQDRVNAIAQTSIDAKLAQVTATLAGMSVQQANATLALQKFQNQTEQQTKLTPAEVALKTQTEDMLGSTLQAMEDLKRAYSLNPNTFDASLPDITQRKILEAAGSKDPKLLNTREQINLLDRGALSQLKATFPGAISDAETRALRELQGLGAKSIEERARIMKNAFRALKSIDERSKRRLDEIKRGVYRDTTSSATPTPEGLE